MLIVTDAACKLMSEMLDEVQPRAGDVLRIVASGSGRSLIVGRIEVSDRVFDYKAIPVLAVAETVFGDSEEFLLDSVLTARGLDLRVMAGGHRLTSAGIAALRP